jgi:anthranilate 1,2-dioxygenase small subunit
MTKEAADARTVQDVLHLIMRVQADYARCIDDDRLESWPDFFDDPCTYKITTAANYREGLEAGIIFANSRGMLVDRVSALREANVYERHSYRHILGVPSILARGNGGVRSETPFLVARIMRDGLTDIFATGRYLDVYMLNGNTAKLAERIVVCDSSRVDTLLALPL